MRERAPGDRRSPAQSPDRGILRSGDPGGGVAVGTTDAARPHGCAMPPTRAGDVRRGFRRPSDGQPVPPHHEGSRVPHPTVIGLLAGCVVLAAHCAEAAAQCTIDPPTSVAAGVSANPEEGLGQSFTPCEEGFVTRITFSVLDPPSGPVRLGLQAGIHLGAPSYSQSVSLVGGLNAIALETPFRVTPGRLYSFGLLPTAGTLEMRYDDENPYADGTLLQSDGTMTGPRPGDLAFKVEIAPGGKKSTTPSSWGAVKELYR